ncbi:MAG: enolase C-terminal domain-like protein [Eubacteriales bacterium]|jgi:L-alanine-DL-glutamate epimerase-like enolase superfamily enzyme|nr:enolase C-terminal domain-like protein [Eubacteriales bacterium]
MPKQIIDTVRIYKFNVTAEQKFSFGTWKNRQHIFLRLGSGGKTGWGECILSTNKPETNLFDAAGCFEQLRGKTITESFSLIRSVFGKWKYAFTEMAELALIDLRGKLMERSAVELLVLNERKPVPGVYVIFSNDPDEVREMTADAISTHRDRFIKVKLFGNTEIDRAVVSAVRSLALRENCFLIGDANCGYSDALDFSLEKLGIQLIMLQTAGLDACEDPAEMSVSDWVELQKFVDPLPLISDYTMRPARRALRTMIPGMSKIYNIHPDTMGSVFDAITLAEKIKANGSTLMIGDDSLIGPGCTAWQQLAIGLGAAWVEATEKDIDSDFYRESLCDTAIKYTDGYYSLTEGKHGFGIEMNERVLSKHAYQILDL